MHKRILKKGLANYEREIFKLEDGGTIALDWAESIPEQSTERAILAIMPGLTSDNNEVYILNIVT